MQSYEAALSLFKAVHPESIDVQILLMCKAGSSKTPLRRVFAEYKYALTHPCSEDVCGTLRDYITSIFDEQFVKNLEAMQWME